MEEKWSSLPPEEFTTPPTSSQQVRSLLQNTRQMQNTHSRAASKTSSAGCVIKVWRMKSETQPPLPFSLLRWPCCDGAKCPEECRQLRSTAAFLFTPFHHDSSLISPDATLRLTETETILCQCRSLGPWTLRVLFLYRFFLYKHGQCCKRVCLMCLCARGCGTWIVPKKKTSKNFCSYFIIRISHFWPSQMHTFFLILNKTGRKPIKTLE